MKVLLIFNNFAGNKRASILLRDVQHELQKKQIDYDLEIPAHPGNGMELVAGANLAAYDAVIAAGGDGTLYEVVNGLFQNPGDQKIPIGIIPIGTGNAFARDMPLQTGEWQKAIEVIKRGNTRKIDVGSFTTEGNRYYFLNILGLGFVADVGQSAHKMKLVGNLSYTLGVLYQTLFLRPTPMTITADDRTIETEVLFVEVSNSQYTANFLMAPYAQLDDGLFDVTILKPLSRLKLLQSFPKILSGEHVYMKEVIHFTTSKINIESKKSKILTPDGELMGSTPVDMECIKQKVEILWP